MTRFLSKSCPSAASTGRKLWESRGIRSGGKHPELGACPAPTGAPDRTRTCAHGSTTEASPNTTPNCLLTMPPDCSNQTAPTPSNCSRSRGTNAAATHDPRSERVARASHPAGGWGTSTRMAVAEFLGVPLNQRGGLKDCGVTGRRDDLGNHSDCNRQQRNSGGDFSDE